MKKLIVVLMSFVVSQPVCASKVDRMENSTVLVHMKVQRDDGKQGWGTCSGVYVDSHEVLSASHCVNMPEGITLKEIWVKNFNGESAKAEVIKIDTGKDLLLLHTTLRGTPVKLARRVRVGDEATLIGMPLGLPWVVTTGVVSMINLTDENDTRHIVTSCIALPGNSGGPLFDKHGHLIGILVQSTSLLGPLGASGLGIAVQLQELKDFLWKD